MDAGGHNVVARALGRALDEHGRFNLQEALAVKVVAGELGDLVAQHDIALHVGPAQVEVAVFQADFLVCARVFLNFKRRRFRGGQDAQLGCAHLDHSRRLRRVDSLLAAAAHFAAHGNDIFAAQALRLVVQHFVRALVKHDLEQAGAVAQLDEDQRAEVADRAYPAAYGDFRAGVRIAQCGAVMGPFQALHGICHSFLSSISL